MQIVNQLLDYSKPWELPDVYLFTGNPVRRLDGAIVMGRGAARQVRDTYPDVQYALGQLIARDPSSLVVFTPVDQDYPIAAKQYIGWFKVKHHWRDDADLELIYQSTQELPRLALDTPNYTYHMNYPGVGNGRLDESGVQPILETLPANVIIYR